MSGATVRVVTRWWIENRFLSLHADAQRILFMLWTAPETPLCGITSMSHALLAERLRLKPGNIRSRLAELEDAEFITQDPDAKLCWIEGYVETQLGGRPAASQAWLVNTAIAVAGLPQTAMVLKFKKVYQLPDQAPKRAKNASVPRGSIRGSDRGSDRGSARGAPIRSVGVGVGLVPATDPPAEAKAAPSAMAGGRRA